MISRIAAAVALLVLAAPLAAHEFWIDPVDFQVAADGTLEATLRVGERLDGPSYSYMPRGFRRFDIVMGEKRVPVEGRPGDRPALDMPAPASGLAVIVHVTQDSTLTYRDRAKFERFVAHKDLGNVIERHSARGLPETGFRERYSRHAKSLVAVGDGEGDDRPLGLVTEIVALANPYTDALDDGLPVRVIYDGRPRVDAQVELFARTPTGAVEVSLHRTDERGVARLPVQPGHSYLADHVVMREIAPQRAEDPVWESLWASLTFAVPPS